MQRSAHPRQSVLRLVLLRSDEVVIDHAEASAAAATEGDLEPVEEDTAGVGDLRRRGACATNKPRHNIASVRAPNSSTATQQQLLPARRRCAAVPPWPDAL